MIQKLFVQKKLDMSSTCDRCGKEPYGWFIENNDKIDYIALCMEHLVDFAKHVEKYEMRRN